MSEIRVLIERAQRKRDIKVRRMMACGWGPTRIAKELHVSRQRAQQIVRRISNGS
jgi:DNA-binding NarL/FixJ family response regulator